jgi:thioredoxin-dependent peroxiredoxin
MRAVYRVVAAAGLASLVVVHAHGAVELKPGDVAPPFTLQGSTGRTYRLADYRGKQAVVLAWFAKAFTSG